MVEIFLEPGFPVFVHLLRKVSLCGDGKPVLFPQRLEHILNAFLQMKFVVGKVVDNLLGLPVDAAVEVFPAQFRGGVKHAYQVCL